MDGWLFDQAERQATALSSMPSPSAVMCLCLPRPPAACVSPLVSVCLSVCLSHSTCTTYFHPSTQEPFPHPPLHINLISFIPSHQTPHIKHIKLTLLYTSTSSSQLHLPPHPSPRSFFPPLPSSYNLPSYPLSLPLLPLTAAAPTLPPPLAVTAPARTARAVAPAADGDAFFFSSETFSGDARGEHTAPPPPPPPPPPVDALPWRRSVVAWFAWFALFAL